MVKGLPLRFHKKRNAFIRGFQRTDCHSLAFPAITGLFMRLHHRYIRQRLRIRLFAEQIVGLELDIISEKIMYMRIFLP